MFSPRQSALISGAASTIALLAYVAYDVVTIGLPQHSSATLDLLMGVVVSVIVGLVVSVTVRLGLFSSSCAGLSAGRAFLIPLIFMPMVAILAFTPIRTEAIVYSMAPDLIDDPRLSAIAVVQGAAATVILLVIGGVAYAVGRTSRNGAGVA